MLSAILGQESLLLYGKERRDKDAALWKKNVNYTWVLETGPYPEDVCHPVYTMPISR